MGARVASTFTRGIDAQDAFGARARGVGQWREDECGSNADRAPELPVMVSIQIGRAEQEEAASRLIGARLTSVQFVLNYLILGFDGQGALTTLVWPEILDSGEVLCFGMNRYRDKLCSLIEKVVKTSRIEQNEIICFDFEDGTGLRIPLRSYEGRGERAILTGPRHYFFVF
jgi:hypothetical protein